jgi:hypothetical protein
MVMSLGTHRLPIEVHKGKDPKAAGLKAFIEAHGGSTGLLISEKPHPLPDIVSCSPHLFLLL